MLLTRLQFLIILFVLLVAPFYVYKMLWISRSEKTNGFVYFMGHTLEVNGNISAHLVIQFSVGRDSISFNADPSFGYGRGDLVPVRYQKDLPSDARVNTFAHIWGDTIIFSLLPLLTLLVLFLTPDRLDPLIPRKSKILIGNRPFLKIIAPR
jgi:hypothetical protein